MAVSLENQVALITGAASGIGYAYAKYLLQNGVKVALCDIDLENCREAANEFSEQFDTENILVLRCDVTSQEEFENAFKSCMGHFKRLDIVVNNAGVFNETMENWDSTMNINYGGVVRGTMLAIKYMGAPNGGKGGTVVQTASIAAFFPNFYFAAMYMSSKRAVVDYTRAIGDKKSYEHLNVKVMALCPGFVDTPFVRVKMNDKYLFDSFQIMANQIFRPFPVQTADNVGKALVHVLKNGNTGECWIVENDEPPRLAVLPDVPY